MDLEDDMILFRVLIVFNGSVYLFGVFFLVEYLELYMWFLEKRSSMDFGVGFLNEILVLDVE